MKRPRLTWPRLRPLLVLAIAGALVLVLRVAQIMVEYVTARAQPEIAALVEPEPEAPPHEIAPAAGAAAPARPAAAKPGEATRSDGEEGRSFTAAELEVLQELAGRRAKLEQRAQEIAQREAVLKAAEQAVERKIQELKTLQAAVEQTLKRHGEEEEARKKSLVKIFEGMKAPEAAKIFEQMDIAQLVDIVERMKERAVAPIFAQLHPVRARQVAAELAKRRQPGATPPPAAAPQAPPRQG